MNSHYHNPLTEELAGSVTLSVWLELMKARIAMASALSAVAGCWLVPSLDPPIGLAVFTGVLLMGGGSCAFNQIQERRSDALMRRTRLRPLPTDRVDSARAAIFAVAIMCAGFIILWFGAGIAAAGLGLLTAFWYNQVYTPLKPRTAMAVFPGALVGAVPPMIGWTAVSGWSTGWIPITAFSLFFFLWQLPHFWLLQLRSGDDYHRAGFASLIQALGVRRAWRTTLAAVVVLAVWTAAVLPIALGSGWGGRISFFALSFGLVFSVFNALRAVSSHSPWVLLLTGRGEIRSSALSVVDRGLRRAFMIVNIFAIFILLVSVAVRLFPL